MGLILFLLLSMVQQQAQKNRPSLETESWTGLRAIIAFQVFTGHLKLHYVPGAGEFLLLSGAVLTIGKTCVIQSPKQYLRYISMRLLRIYPAVWVSEAFAHSNLYESRNVSPVHQLITMPFLHPSHFFQSQALYIRHVGPLNLWFISTVVCLYLCCPFLDMFLTYCGTRRSITKCAGFALACYVMQLGVVAVAFHTRCPAEWRGCSRGDVEPSHYPRNILGHDVLLYTHPVARLPQFLLGILVSHSLHATASARAEDSPEDTDKDVGMFSSFLGVLTDAAMLSIVGLVFYSRHIKHWGLSRHIKYWIVIRNFNLFSPVFAMLLFGLGHPRVSSLSKFFLTRPVILELGKISFGVYLYGALLSHMANHIVHKESLDLDWWHYFGIYCNTLLVAFLSYHVLEEPTQRLVRWLWALPNK